MSLFLEEDEPVLLFYYYYYYYSITVGGLVDRNTVLEM